MSVLNILSVKIKIKFKQKKKNRNQKLIKDGIK